MKLEKSTPKRKSGRPCQGSAPKKHGTFRVDAKLLGLLKRDFGSVSKGIEALLLDRYRDQLDHPVIDL